MLGVRRPPAIFMSRKVLGSVQFRRGDSDPGPKPGSAQKIDLCPGPGRAPAQLGPDLRGKMGIYYKLFLPTVGLLRLRLTQRAGFSALCMLFMGKDPVPEIGMLVLLGSLSLPEKNMLSLSSEQGGGLCNALRSSRRRGLRATLAGGGGQATSSCVCLEREGWKKSGGGGAPGAVAGLRSVGGGCFGGEGGRRK
ncbi:uncharacterized protein A4U43_C07F29690 [Asparagus officinalis]|uniref:Uncharacterized protein n=1 Tax=Asparagus officinalis TaxID=4686 RepID=A0A5P1EFU1_ASPOF|nr:uncharacterized protein A4U43_C07F29690 [Asparagus officinalis]